MYVRDTASNRSLWTQRGQRFLCDLMAGSSRLSHMVHEFERALRGTAPADARALTGKIRSAADAQDLWHLRADIVAVVTRAYDRWEAQTRLDDLDSLFDHAGPRSQVPA